MDEQRLDVAIILMPYGFLITASSWKGQGILQSSWEILFTQAFSQTQRIQPSNDYIQIVGLDHGGISIWVYVGKM